MQQVVRFPSWPIITDPDLAHHALNLVVELERARRNPSARRAKKRFDAVVATLWASAPHFIPTLIEEVARVFIYTRNLHAAMQFFGMARDAEHTYSLEINEARHRAAFTKFAQAGAISGKVMSAEAKRCGDASFILGLVAAQAEVGVPPYTGLARDLPSIPHKELLDAPAPTPGFKRATLAFLSTMPKVVIKHAAASELLWQLKPQESKALGFIARMHKLGFVQQMSGDKPRFAQ